MFYSLLVLFINPKYSSWFGTWWMSSLFHFVLCICKDIFLSKKKTKKRTCLPISQIFKQKTIIISFVKISLQKPNWFVLVCIQLFFILWNQPLHHAVKNGDVRMINQLLLDGMPLNVNDWSFVTSVYLATLSTRTHAVKLVLSEVADVNRQHPYGKNTPSHWATLSKNTEVGQGSRHQLKK